MKISLVQNSDGSFSRAIQDALTWSNTLYIGAAYGSYGAFERFRTPLEAFLRNNGKIRALFDIEEFITEKRLIEELATIPGDSECKVYIRPGTPTGNPRGHYHPKFYLFHDHQRYCAMVGSANLTLGGIRDNIECSLCVTGEQNGDSLFQELNGFFNEIWSAEHAINVLNHQRLLDAYQEAFPMQSRERNIRDKWLAKLRKNLAPEADEIFRAQTTVLNCEFAYLQGLMSANGRIDLGKQVLTIDLERRVANKGTPYEGEYYNPDISDYRIPQYEAHKRDIDKITESLGPLSRHLGTGGRIQPAHVEGYHFQITIEFGQDSALLQEIRSQNPPSAKNKLVPSVPDWIKRSTDVEIVRSFVKGYCDLKSRMSDSDGIYKTHGNRKVYSSLRMGISVPHDASAFLKDFVALLERIGIREGVSVTDPTRRTRENLIRIDVRNVPYELIGTHWRRIFLMDFVSYIRTRRDRTAD
jgi:HKD family nuclease